MHLAPLQLGTMRSLYSANTNLGRCGSQLDLLTGGLGPSAAAGLGTAAGAGVGHAGAAAAAAAAHAGVVEELTPEELPVDWSLKRSVVVASGSRFACHDLAQAAAPRTRECGYTRDKVLVVFAFGAWVCCKDL